MNYAQSRLKVLLKTKGTGQTMSKALSFEDCSDIKSLSTSPDINPITFATLFTALYMLDRNKAEEDLLNTLKKQSISAYILSNSNSPFSNLVQKLIHFKNLTPNEIKMFCKLVFGPEFDGIQAAVCFEALRIKRESDDENRLFLEHLRKHSLQKHVNLPYLVDICDPFDGLNKAYPIGHLTASLLASFGIPTLIQGAYAVGPKFGLSYPMLFKACNKNAFLKLDKVISQLKNPTIGWAYLDQCIASPLIHRFCLFRIAMLKRSLFSTLEKGLKPIKSKENYAHITCFTHPPYKKHLYRLFSPDGDPTLLLRGIQGSNQLPLDRRAPWLYFDNKIENNDFVKPELAGLNLKNPINNKDRLLTTNSKTIANWKQLSEATLSGQKTELYTPLLYNTWHLLERFSFLPKLSIKELEKNLKNKKALQHWNLAHAK